MAARALLLDRDGVINVDHGYVGTPERFDFAEGIFALTRRAVDLGYRTVVTTNQSGIARGFFDEAAFARLTRWMTARFAEEGVRLAAVLHCPYLPGAADPAYDRDSLWRKPGPGMILEARRRLDLDLARSVFLGDRPSDMAAARAAGVGVRLFLDAQGRGCPDATATVGSPSAAIAHLRAPLRPSSRGIRP